ncbi:5603_t:CDS:2 [Dentiscutata erythropus]|uniref:5603_t:CDS:1 n=1 Tax=Dentiscutata erythropus TaxID=1348616 RepID=A0A9N9I699_9GLOM|nr:5603_t:CDS:2 [Dentiscutata erythropus]
MLIHSLIIYTLNIISTILVSGKFIPQQRYLQTSVLDDDKFRWITFKERVQPAQFNNQIYIFDTLNYEWVTNTSRTSNNITNATSNQDQSNEKTNMPSNLRISVVGIVCIVIGLLIIFTIVGVLIYRKYKNYIMEEKMTESFHELLAT